MTVIPPPSDNDPDAPLKIAGYDAVEPSKIDDGRITIDFVLSRDVTELEEEICDQIASYEFDLQTGLNWFRFGPMAVAKIPAWIETLNGQLAYIEEEAHKVERRVENTLKAAHDVLATLKF